MNVDQPTNLMKTHLSDKEEMRWQGLPVWVRQRMESLARKVETAQKHHSSITSLLDHQPGEGEENLYPGTLTVGSPMDDVTPIRFGTQHRHAATACFQTGLAWGDEIQASLRQHHATKEWALRLSSTSGSLMVVPECSNVVTIRNARY